MIAFLLLLKTFSSKVLEVILKYPTYVIIVILSLIIWYYYSLNTSNLEKIANLNTAKIALEKTVKEANAAIKEQNNSILSYKNLVSDLDNRLIEASKTKIEIDTKVDKWQKHDAPIKDVDAFIWLQDKATELKSWAN